MATLWGKKFLKSPYLKNRSQQENYVGVLQKAQWLYNPYTQEMTLVEIGQNVTTLFATTCDY
jgi:hypothetical protein